MAEKESAVEKSESPSPEPSNEASNAAAVGKQSTVTDEEWIAMHNVLSNIYAHRVDEYDFDLPYYNTIFSALTTKLAAMTLQKYSTGK